MVATRPGSAGRPSSAGMTATIANASPVGGHLPEWTGEDLHAPELKVGPALGPASPVSCGAVASGIESRPEAPAGALIKQCLVREASLQARIGFQRTMRSGSAMAPGVRHLAVLGQDASRFTAKNEY